MQVINHGLSLTQPCRSVSEVLVLEISYNYVLYWSNAKMMKKRPRDLLFLVAVSRNHST